MEREQVVITDTEEYGDNTSGTFEEVFPKQVITVTYE